MKQINNTKNPLVSVVLPCYNGEKFVEEALLSLQNQTYQNLEIIVIDDGSTDNSKEIIQSFVAKDKRFVLLENEQNLRLIKTLNKGIRAAKGAFIARMDADDVSLPTRIEEELQFLQQHENVDIVSTGFQQIDEEGHIYPTSHVKATSAKTCQFLSYLRNPIVHPALLGRTACFKQNLFEVSEQNLHTEDYALWIRMMKKGIQFASLNKALYLYRINTGSVSHQNNELQFKNSLANSHPYAQAYFGIKFPIEVYQIMANKIIYPVKFKQVFKAMNLLNFFKKSFFEKNKELTSSEKKEINRLVREQKIDGLIQLLKKNTFSIKLSALAAILLNIFTFLHPDSLRFITNKFNS